MTQPAPRVKARRPPRTHRDTLADLFMAAWICVLLQGALRKWLFPGATFLYLIQDVPLLMAYVYALWKGLVWNSKLAWFCIVVSLILSMESLVQVIVVSLPLRTFVIGLHHYIFYLPILFLAPVCYNHKHRQRFLRWNLIAAVPMAMIATLQSRSPKGAFINRTSAGDDTGFGLADDTVRATGTFNFTMFYSVWCGVAAAMVVGEWLLPPEQRCFKSKLLLLVCTLSAVLASLVSGSRLAIVLAGLGFMGGFAAVVVTRNIRLILRFSAILVMLPVLTLLAYFVVPTSFKAVINRFSGESYQQDLVTRFVHGFLGFTYAAPYSVLGMGVGYGIPAANPAAGGGLVLSENEPIRILDEMGTFVGTAIVVLRYLAGPALVLVGFRALLLRRGHSFPHAVPFALICLPTIMIGELVRSAPMLATQAFFPLALTYSAILFRHEPLGSGSAQTSATRSL